MSETITCNSVVRSVVVNRPIRMIERIQELTLEGEANSFGYGNDLRDGDVVIEEVRPVQERVRTESSRVRVLGDQARVDVATILRVSQILRVKTEGIGVALHWRAL